jgi:hypothetical protein
MQHVAPEHSPIDLIVLVDELIDAYVTWRTGCSALKRSYGLWSTCDRRHRDAAFGVYVAALDREEQAATAYRRLLEQITMLETELRGCPPPPDLTAPAGSAGMVLWSARSIAQILGLRSGGQAPAGLVSAPLTLRPLVEQLGSARGPEAQAAAEARRKNSQRSRNHSENDDAWLPRQERERERRRPAGHPSGEDGNRDQQREDAHRCDT